MIVRRCSGYSESQDCDELQHLADRVACMIYE